MKRLWPLIMFVILGCSTKAPDTALTIRLINNKHDLQITGTDPAIMREIAKDTSVNWQSLFAVYRMPADTDLKAYQPTQPGQYQLKNNALVFTPDTAFAPQQTYFVRCYNYAGNKSVWDYVRGKTTIRKLHYIDLIFRQ